MTKTIIHIALIILGGYLIIMGLSTLVNSDILWGIIEMVIGFSLIMLTVILEDYDQ